jgi:hypothetical protein
MILLANLCIDVGYNGSFGVLYLVLSALLVANFLFPFEQLNALVWQVRLAGCGRGDRIPPIRRSADICQSI